VRIGITCYPTYGGSGIVATELGHELAARGHEIHFISYAPPIRMDLGAENVRYHEVEVTNYPLFQFPPYCLALASRLAEVAERYELDLLHMHYAIPHAVSALLARQMTPRRLPFVTTLHGTDVTLVGTEPSYLPITRFAIEQSDAVTVVSDFLRTETRETFGTQRPIELIHNFVNTELYRPREPLAMARRPRLLHISNFRPVKRVLDCVRILAVAREQVDCELWMAGDGPDRSPAERLVTELGLSRYVRFLGKQDHIERLIPQCDVLLMPSEREAFGLAALEAMACGVPPVAASSGGVTELITDGVDGFLAPVGDVTSMGQMVASLLASDSRREAAAEAARTTAVERFSTDRIIPEYETLYQGLTA
jgi:N-acetyl-alpha-D-glucosaminyl L-malate synthase BshA